MERNVLYPGQSCQTGAEDQNITKHINLSCNDSNASQMPTTMVTFLPSPYDSDPARIENISSATTHPPFSTFNEKKQAKASISRFTPTLRASLTSFIPHDQHNFSSTFLENANLQKTYNSLYFERAYENTTESSPSMNNAFISGFNTNWRRNTVMEKIERQESEYVRMTSPVSEIVVNDDVKVEVIEPVKQRDLAMQPDKRSEDCVNAMTIDDCLRGRNNFYGAQRHNCEASGIPRFTLGKAYLENSFEAAGPDIRDSLFQTKWCKECSDTSSHQKTHDCSISMGRLEENCSELDAKRNITLEYEREIEGLSSSAACLEAQSVNELSWGRQSIMSTIYIGSEVGSSSPTILSNQTDEIFSTKDQFSNATALFDSHSALRSMTSYACAYSDSDVHEWSSESGKPEDFEVLQDAPRWQTSLQTNPNKFSDSECSANVVASEVKQFPSSDQISRVVHPRVAIDQNIILIKSVPTRWTESAIIKMFAAYGDINDSFLATNPHTKTFYGFVEYNDIRSASHAYNHIDEEFFTDVSDKILDWVDLDEIEISPYKKSLFKVLSAPSSPQMTDEKYYYPQELIPEQEFLETSKDKTFLDYSEESSQAYHCETDDDRTRQILFESIFENNSATMEEVYTPSSETYMSFNQSYDCDKPRVNLIEKPENLNESYIISGRVFAGLNKNAWDNSEAAFKCECNDAQQFQAEKIGASKTSGNIFQSIYGLDYMNQHEQVSSTSSGLTSKLDSVFPASYKKDSPLCLNQSNQANFNKYSHDAPFMLHDTKILPSPSQHNSKKPAKNSSHSKKSDTIIPENNIFVFYVPPSWNLESLRQHFEVFGKIRSIAFPVDEGTPWGHKGYGFICYESPEDARSAIKEMNGKEVRPDRRLKVELKKNVPQNGKKAKASRARMRGKKLRQTKPNVPLHGT